MKKYNVLIFLYLLVSCSVQENKNNEMELVYQIPSKLGEGAIWNYQTDELYWIDIEGEKLHIYDSKTKKPYVEIETSNQKFKRQDVKLGISDGVNAELISGVSKTDKIKVWNKTEPDKRGEVEDNGWN